MYFTLIITALFHLQCLHLPITTISLTHNTHIHMPQLEEIDVYERKLSQHYKHAEGIHNREPYMPFVSGDGFRSIADYIFDETNVGHSESNKLTWTVDPVSINDGAVIFIKVDLLSIFVSSVIPLIRGSYSLIVHNGDNSAPDLQDDYERPYAHYETGRALESEYLNKRLTALHAQNLWWKDRHHNAKPIYAHCIPIGKYLFINISTSKQVTYMCIKSYLFLHYRYTKSLYTEFRNRKLCCSTA